MYREYPNFLTPPSELRLLSLEAKVWARPAKATRLQQTSADTQRLRSKLHSEAHQAMEEKVKALSEDDV